MKLNMASMALVAASLSSTSSLVGAFTRPINHHRGALATLSKLHFSSSKQPTTTTQQAAASAVGHRRRKALKYNTATLIERASAIKGMYKDGALFLSTTEETTTTTATKTDSTTNESSTSNNAESLDNLFPNKGKSILDLPPRMRFAPSPTGSLHVGGARTALYNWLVAKKGQLDYTEGGDGAFVLRVEDTDLARSTKESEESVIADLTWLGLLWDEGPDMPLAKYGPYRQSERNAIYSKVANSLIEQGKAYPCFCTPEELDVMKAKMEAEGIPPRYDGTWRDADPEIVATKIAAGDPYTVRFKVPPGARVVIDDAVRGTVSWDAEATVGDFILLRSSGVPHRTR